ncbi:hypothetical protein BH11ACT4_BH11ACT4_07130 [soil metagenome]
MTTTARPTRRDATENRAALLAAARAELNRDPDASLEVIAARAGLSRRAVYGHFATRDDLLRELIGLGVARVSSALEGVNHADPVVRLALIAARLWHEIESVRVMAIFAVRGPLTAYTADRLGIIRAWVADAIAQGVDSGAMRADIPKRQLARLVEDAVLAGLALSVSERIAASDGHRLVMLLALGTVGLSAGQAAELIDSHRELDWSAT